MPSPEHDYRHLVSLIGAAQAEAARAGRAAASVADLLDEAARAARGLLPGDGRADEGLRPDELTTGNDK